MSAEGSCGSPSTDFPTTVSSEVPFHQRRNSQIPLDLFHPYGDDYPPVFVLCHPSTRKLAEKIVEKANLEERTSCSSTPSGAKVHVEQ